METEKWRTIPEFPSYVISNKGRVANKVTGKILKETKGRVSLGKSNFHSVSKIYHRLWFSEEAKKIKGFSDYKIMKDGTVINLSGKKLSVSNGLVRLNGDDGQRTALNVEKLKNEIWQLSLK